ncbi:MAG: DUF4097 family beta strand repeat-containing protein [Treponemataceae bacterium]
MKRNLKMAFAWFALAFVATGLFLYALLNESYIGIIGFPFTGYNRERTVLEEAYFDKSEISSIRVSVFSDNIKILKSSDDKFLIKIIGYKNNNKNFELENKNGCLEISRQQWRRQKSFFINYSSYSHIDIYVPEFNESETTSDEKSENLPDIYIKGTSGDVEIHDVALNNFVFERSSGDLYFRNTKLKKAFESIASSGNTYGKLYCPGFESTSNSGDLRLKLLAEPTAEISGSLSSGDFRLDLPSNMQGFSLNFHSRSGDYFNDFTGTRDEKKVDEVYKNGNIKISIETSSGDCRIRKY